MVVTKTLLCRRCVCSILLIHINLITVFFLRAKSTRLYIAVNKKKKLRLVGYIRLAFDVLKGECPEKYVACLANCGTLWMKLYELFLNLTRVVTSSFETPFLWCVKIASYDI
jgi:hypothetical protein